MEARDLGTPTPLSSDLDLMIYVRNINDYEPQFLVDVFEVRFTEENVPGLETILLPETIDRDEVDDLDDPPTQVCYFIVGGNDDGFFTLDIFKHELSVSELSKPLARIWSRKIRDLQNKIEKFVRTKLVESFICLMKKSKNIYNFFSQTAKNLDREEQEEYLLLIKATEDCNTVPGNQSFFDETDDTLLKVIVTVDDINDNPPKFVSKIFTGGVTTEADFGTQFMHVKVRFKFILKFS